MPCPNSSPNFSAGSLDGQPAPKGVGVLHSVAQFKAFSEKSLYTHTHGKVLEIGFNCATLCPPPSGYLQDDGGWGAQHLPLARRYGKSGIGRFLQHRLTPPSWALSQKARGKSPPSGGVAGAAVTPLRAGADLQQFPDALPKQPKVVFL